MTWRFGARSDVGLHRDGNEDSFFAGSRLLVVADGVGGSAAGEIASSLAVHALQPLESDTSITDPLPALGAATRTANTDVRQAIQADRALSGMGTTLTALLWSGETLGLAQLGDSRGYRLRGGELTQITKDHTLVQSLVEEGQITPDEALTHPRRSWILRALDGREESEPDLEILDPQPGDRYLLCSDGLSDYVDLAAIAAALAGDDPQLASERLVDLALKAGAPDNVTCVVADPVEDAIAQPPLIGGAAAVPREPVKTAGSPADFLTDPPDGEPAGKRRSLAKRLTLIIGAVVVLVVAAIVGTVIYVNHQWYVASSHGNVAIYQGVKGSAAGHKLQKVHQLSQVPVTALPQTDRQDVLQGRNTYSKESSAQAYVTRLTSDACTEAQAKASASAAAASASPTPTPSSTSSKRNQKVRPTTSPTPTLPAYCSQ
jgi:protein phosphatase